MSVDGSVLALGVRLAIEMLEEVIAGLDQNLFEKKRTTSGFGTSGFRGEGEFGSRSFRAGGKDFF